MGLSSLASREQYGRRCNQALLELVAAVEQALETFALPGPSPREHANNSRERKDPERMLLLVCCVPNSVGSWVPDGHGANGHCTQAWGHKAQPVHRTRGRRCDWEYMEAARVVFVRGAGLVCGGVREMGV